VLKALRKVQY
jgi:hypothetical protein